MKGLSKYLGLVGVALFAGIVLYFDPQKILASLLKTNLLLFALGVLALLPLLFLKALKALLEVIRHKTHRRGGCWRAGERISETA